jgi:hypothetical protein
LPTSFELLLVSPWVRYCVGGEIIRVLVVLLLLPNAEAGNAAADFCVPAAAREPQVGMVLTFEVEEDMLPGGVREMRLKG